jgi:oligoendopeptidase F
MSKEEMRWDLSQLVASTDPATVRRTLESMVAEAGKLRDEYYNKIGGLDAEGLVEFLELSDSMTLKYGGVTLYCSLLYSANALDETAKQLNDASRTSLMKMGQTLAFVDIEMGKLIANKPALVEDPALAEYKHYLERILRSVPYMLLDKEEQLILAKDKNGVDAWQQLQNDWLSTRTYEIEVEGEKKTMPYGEIIGLYQNPNRDLRMRANQIVYEELGRDEIIWASAIRSVCADHMQICDIRDYPTAMTQSLISNDVDQETIDSLMSTIVKSTSLYQRYLRLKAKLMDLDKLANWDIIAPLPNAPEKVYTWKESRNEVVSAYSEFDSQLGAWADEMFERNHLDGEVRKGKSSGAFCATWLAGKSAYILQSFNGTVGNVSTQAHEMGHAIHAYLGSRAQKPSNYKIGSCIAECGSNFGELLLFDRLLSKTTTKEEKQAILATVLDSFGMSVFQVSARVFFEQSMYDTITEGGFLDGETVASLWTAARDKIYGDAVDWLEVMKWEWTMKVHYYMPNYRFYNYPYVFAKLFVFGLYRLYKEQGEAFVSKLKSLLAAGSSKSPWQLGKELGLDIRTEEFWMKGMRQVEEFIDMLEETL